MSDNTKETSEYRSSKLDWWEHLIPGYNQYRMANAILSKFIPAKIALRDLVRHNVNVPIRKSLKLPINDVTYTESDFTPEYNAVLDSIVRDVADKHYPNWKERTANGDTIKFHISGNDYMGTDYGRVRNRKNSQTFVEKLTNPKYQIEHTLGSFDAQITDNDITVTDPGGFDFKDVSISPIGKVGQYKNNKLAYYQKLAEAYKNGQLGTYGVVRSLESMHGTPSSAPDNEKIMFNIKHKRKKQDE